MYFILITGVIKVIMGREHKHARFCERDTRLCRLMEFYAEGFMKDEEDGHSLISQFFKRINEFKEEEIKRYNLNSRKRQSYLGVYHGIISYEVPTDYEEYLLKQMKLFEKREEMKKRKNAGENYENGKRKSDDNGCEAAKKKQRMSDCHMGQWSNCEKETTDNDSNGEGSTANGERENVNGETGPINGERASTFGARASARGGRRWLNDEARWVNDQGRSSSEEGETVNEEGEAVNDGGEAANEGGERVNGAEWHGGVKFESISMDELDEQLASINKVYDDYSKEDWDRQLREWRDMIEGAVKFLPKKDEKKKKTEEKGRNEKNRNEKNRNDENDCIVID